MKNFDKIKIMISAGALVVVILCGFVYMNYFKTYDVVFDSRMGTSIEAQKVKKGEVALKPNDPVMSGYTFEGWYLNDEEYDFSSKVEKNITLIGKWQKLGEDD